MILVTGGTGIVGAHVLLELCSNKKPVLAIFRSEKSKNVVRNVFEYYNSSDLFSSICWAEADVTDVDRLDELFVGISEVYHCAALVSFSAKDRAWMSKVNVEGTANLVNLSLLHGVEKFAFVSSIAALGREVSGKQYVESSQWVNSRENSFYAITKYNAEREVWRGAAEGLKVVIVNPGIVIGPGSLGKSSGSMFTAVKRGLKFFTEGTNGFVDARDIARIMFRLMASSVENNRYILVSENLSYKEVFEHIAHGFSAKEANIRARKWMTGIAWRVLGVLSYLNGKEPFITKETARSSHQKNAYNNQKIRQELDYNFIPVSNACLDACNFIKRYYN